MLVIPRKARTLAVVATLAVFIFAALFFILTRDPMMLVFGFIASLAAGGMVLLGGLLLGGRPGEI